MNAGDAAEQSRLDVGLPRLVLPRLYAVIDARLLAAWGMELERFARDLQAAGVRLVQYRDKQGSPREILAAAETLRRIFEPASAKLILNDRADLAVLAGCDGVHVGQEDLPAADARRIAGAEAMVGLSTHNEEQVRAALQAPVDYVAIGPVFATATKANPDPTVGLEGVRMARALTQRPVVAIGGMGAENARQAVEAGADAVAVVSGLFRRGESTVETVGRLLDALG